MKFQTQLYLSLGIVWTLFTAVSRVWYYYDVKQGLLESERSTAMSLAAAIAAAIAPEELSKTQISELAAQLLRIRNGNQSAGIDVRHIYFLRPLPDDPNQIEITIDVEDSPEETYSIRDTVWPEAVQNGIRDHVRENWATKKPYRGEQEPNGKSWITGIAPLFDREHTYLATLAVDLSATPIEKAIHHMLILAIISGGSMLLVGLLLAVGMAHIATRSLASITRAVKEISRGNFHVQIEVKSKDEFGQLAQAIQQMAKGLEENQRLKMSFVRYVSKHIMDKILSSDISIALKGERRKITVLFSDIRHFTALAEKLPPEEVVSLLNEYLGKMLTVIFDHSGTIDRFLGDGIMVEFGAPLEDPIQEKHAVDASLEMQRALQRLNQMWGEERSLNLEMGIGIHTGLAVVGNIGSERRMEYTAIGDTVTIASMLERESKKQRVEILMSQTTAEALGEEYTIRSLGLLKLPGRESPIEAFTIEG